MANFQNSVLIFASVLLVICLLIFLYIIIKNKYSSTNNWPPLVSNCPDYWVDSAGNGSNCINSKDLGTCKEPMNFTVAPYIGDSGACSKYNWATTCGVTWDGITSSDINPCSSPTTNT